MSFTIYTTDQGEKVFSSHEDARVFEAFCLGMGIDYSMTYPDGQVKSIEFKKGIMQSIIDIDEKIKRVNQQLYFLEENKNISTQERTEIKAYYENKLKSYKERRSALSKNFYVKAEGFTKKE